MNYKINDIVKLVNGKAIIVGTKEVPYYSVAFRTEFYPENGFDFVILHHTGKNNEDKFEGRDNIKESQIISFVKHLDFED